MKLIHAELSEKKRAVILKSVLWNTIIEIFKEEKGIDISNFMSSIRKQSDVFFITFSKPIIMAEMLILEDRIKESFSQKLSKM